jgi:hypothetical protein
MEYLTHHTKNNQNRGVQSDVLQTRWSAFDFTPISTEDSLALQSCGQDKLECTRLHSKFLLRHHNFSTVRTACHRLLDKQVTTCYTLLNEQVIPCPVSRLYTAWQASYSLFAKQLSACSLRRLNTAQRAGYSVHCLPSRLHATCLPRGLQTARRAVYTLLGE